MVTYRSKIHSPLEADPTKYRTDVLSPLDANPIKYRSREHSPLLEALPPTIYGVQGFPAGSPDGGQTKLVKRAGSDLSLISQVDLGDYSRGGVSNWPGIRYVASEDTLIIMSHDYSLGGAAVQWRIQKRNVSDLSIVYNFLYDVNLLPNPTYFGGVWSRIRLSDDGVHFYCWMTETRHISQLFQKRRISDGSLVWNRVFGTYPGYHLYMDVCLYSGNLYAIGMDYYNRLYLCKFTESNIDVWSFRDTVNMDYYYGAGIYVDSGGIYVGYYKGTTHYWTVQKWTDDATPSLVWSQSPGSSAHPYRIIGDGANIIIVGGLGSARYEKRTKDDGTLLCSGGWQVGGANKALDLTPISNGIFYVGGHDSGADYRARYEKVKSIDLTTETFITVPAPVTQVSTTGITSG